MFELSYRIVLHDYDDFSGQNGFFQIKCNGFAYGDIYAKEIEQHMDPDALYRWMEWIVRVCTCLMTEDYVVLSDIESHKSWIEFKKHGDRLCVSIVEAEKLNKINRKIYDVGFHLDGRKPGIWTDQLVDFQQFKGEIIKKGTEYLETALSYEPENTSLNELKDKIEKLQECRNILKRLDNE